MRTTRGLPQVWLDGSTIGSFAKPNFSSGRTSNFDLQILTSTKQFLIISGTSRRNTNPTPAASPDRCTSPQSSIPSMFCVK